MTTTLAAWSARGGCLGPPFIGLRHLRKTPRPRPGPRPPAKGPACWSLPRPRSYPRANSGAEGPPRPDDREPPGLSRIPCPRGSSRRRTPRPCSPETRPRSARGLPTRRHSMRRRLTYPRRRPAGFRSAEPDLDPAREGGTDRRLGGRDGRWSRRRSMVPLPPRDTVTQLIGAIRRVGPPVVPSAARTLGTSRSYLPILWTRWELTRIGCSDAYLRSHWAVDGRGGRAAGRWASGQGLWNRCMTPTAPVIARPSPDAGISTFEAPTS